jgi:protein deglycase
MPKVAVVLADGFEEVEAMSIIDVLRRAGIETVIAGLHEGRIISTRKVNVVPDTTIDAINADDFDMLVLPGGQPGTDNMNADAHVKKLIKDFSQKGKLLGAICAAPIVLAAAGVLQGKRVTSYPGYQEDLIGAIYEEKPVVADGNVFTSRGPGTALAFALALVERLAGKEKSEKVRQAMLIP